MKCGLSQGRKYERKGKEKWKWMIDMGKMEEPESLERPEMVRGRRSDQVGKVEGGGYRACGFI